MGLKQDKHILSASYYYFILFLYIILVVLSMNTSPDRQNYIYFFNYPERSRFEVGFRYIGLCLKYLSFPAELSIVLICVLIFLFAKKTIDNLFQGDKTYVSLIFTIFFFGIGSVYSFIQLRAGLAIWMCLFFYSCYIKKDNKIFILITFFSSLFHVVTFFISVILFMYYILKINSKLLFMGITFFILFLYLYFEQIISTLGFSNYYLYYIDELNLNLRKSLTILVFFAFLPFLFIFKTSKVFSRHSFVTISIPAVSFAYLSYFDLIIKLFYPFLIIIFLGVPIVLYIKLKTYNEKLLLCGVLITFIPLSIAYTLLKVRII